MKTIPKGVECILHNYGSCHFKGMYVSIPIMIPVQLWYALILIIIRNAMYINYNIHSNIIMHKVHKHSIYMVKLIRGARGLPVFTVTL